jgi:hypothetical protein
MNRKLWSVRRLVPLGIVAVAGTAAVAQAAGVSGTATRRHPVHVQHASTVPMNAVLTGAIPRGGGAVCSTRRPPATTAAAPPSDTLKNAFGILRRDRTDDDTLPAKALAALKARGFEPVDPQSARLLRADGGARAWVVPVPDVGGASGFVICGRPGRSAAVKPREGSPSSRSAARRSAAAVRWSTCSAVRRRRRSTPAPAPAATCSASPGSSPTASTSSS